jgi:hypothetical protein
MMTCRDYTIPSRIAEAVREDSLALQKRPEPERSLSIVNESAARPVDGFAARRDVAVLIVALFIVVDGRGLVLIVVMRIFILLI